MLRDLARDAGMPAAKAHRYLVSYMRMGLVEQDANSGRYDLGHFALELGLAGLARLDPVRLAAPILDDLCEAIEETVALAMWGNHGATIVRWAEMGGPVTVALRTGTVLPLITSATGRAFVAFYRSPYLKAMLKKEIKEYAVQIHNAATVINRELEGDIEKIRHHGISCTSGSLTPGINGFSAPVFDHTGNMVAAITALRPAGNFPLEWDGPLARAVKEAAGLLTQRLGYNSTSSASSS